MRDLNASSNLNSLTIAQLKEELEARGVTDLKKCKLKKDYVELLHQRLQEIEQGGGAVPAAVADDAAKAAAAAEAEEAARKAAEEARLKEEAARQAAAAEEKRKAEEAEAAAKQAEKEAAERKAEEARLQAAAAEEKRRAEENAKREAEMRAAEEEAKKQEELRRREARQQEEEARRKREEAEAERLEMEKQKAEKARREHQEKLRKEAEEVAKAEEEERKAREAAQKSLDEAKQPKAQDVPNDITDAARNVPLDTEQDRVTGTETQAMDVDEARRQREEDELRRKLLESQARKSGEHGVKRAGSQQESDAGSDRKRRRGWGSSAAATTTAPTAINTDILKDLITEVVTHEPAQASAEGDKPNHVHEEEAAHDSQPAADVEITDVVDDDDSETATASLHIKNFTRPLQLREVTSLLEEHGKLIEGEDGFWMDKQKRRCCCTFESVDMARKAKKNIHGLRFPLGNPKKLEVEYVTLEELPGLRVDDAAVPDRRRSDREAPAVARVDSERSRNGDQRAPEEPPAEGLHLEKLFNKTVAEPHIFWKPHTDAEVQEKLQKEAENEKRR